MICKIIIFIYSKYNFDSYSFIHLFFIYFPFTILFVFIIFIRFILYLCYASATTLEMHAGCMQPACRLHAACMQPATSCMQDAATCNLLHTIVCRLHEACMKPACRLQPPACSLLQPATSCIRSYSQKARQSAQLFVDTDAIHNIQSIDIHHEYIILENYFCIFIVGYIASSFIILRWIFSSYFNTFCLLS